ncbi:MAG: hypothetical protein KIT83_15135 [Bryobacterales bacterium]|nr:hypothetical protein [Bryobacterales bacterium]
MTVTFFVMLLLLGGAAVVVLRSTRRLPAGKVAVVLRFGRAINAVGEGNTVIVLPFVDQLAYLPAGEQLIEGKVPATLADNVEARIQFDGRFTIHSPVAAFQRIPLFSSSTTADLQELSPYALGALTVQLPPLLEDASVEAVVDRRSRLASEWKAAANLQLEPMGLAFTSLSIRDLGLPSHLAAEFELRSYQRSLDDEVSEAGSAA